MSTSIRLARYGKKNQPVYRIIVTETRSKRNGQYSDNIGIYNPSVNPPVLQIDQTKFEKWKKNGAIISDGLNRLLKNQNK